MPEVVSGQLNYPST